MSKRLVFQGESAPWKDDLASRCSTCDHLLFIHRDQLDNPKMSRYGVGKVGECLYAGCRCKSAAAPAPSMGSVIGRVARAAVPLFAFVAALCSVLTAPAAAIPITHVVVVMQENRSVDNLFNGFTGADTVTCGAQSGRGRACVPLTAMTLASNFDPCHGHACFMTEADLNQQTSQYAMDGWDQATFSGCSVGCTYNPSAYYYVNPTYTTTYWSLATNFAFADEMHQNNGGPSLPSHQFMIAGQAGFPYSISENMNSGDAGCENSGTTNAIYVQSFPGVEGPGTYLACTDYAVIFDLLDKAGVSWKYYVHTLSPTGIEALWAAPYVVQHMNNSGPTMAKVQRSSQFFTDVTNHTLPSVSYIMPSAANSDHAGSNSSDGTAGPKWVKSITDAIGGSSFYWGNTTILINWDDWGGWYDHVPPYCPLNATAAFCSTSVGFRTPLIVVSPYARAGLVDHTVRSQAAILNYIESTFSLPSLGTLDAYTDNLGSMFNYGQSPLTYVSPPTPAPNSDP